MCCLFSVFLIKPISFESYKAIYQFFLLPIVFDIFYLLMITFSAFYFDMSEHTGLAHIFFITNWFYLYWMLVEIMNTGTLVMTLIYGCDMMASLICKLRHLATPSDFLGHIQIFSFRDSRKHCWDRIGAHSSTAAPWKMIIRIRVSRKCLKKSPK